MNREERVRILIDYLKKENTGYASLADPVDYTGRRRLLRSLMNVRWPGEADPEYTRIQDELLKEEAEQKGIVEWGQLPTIGGQFPCETIKNVDKISLWRGDITRLSVDAIVNAANSQMLGCFVPCHGCIDNAIHSAAGIQLRNECAQIMEAQGHEEPTGKAKITTEKQEEELKSCYLNCMKLAEKEGLKSIAFCCISTGEFHFPNKLAAEIAVKTVDKYLSSSKLERVIFNVFKEEDYNIYKKIFA